MYSGLFRDKKQMKEASMQDMMDNLVPIHVRDSCANVLIPLNKCRRANMYAPWSCADEKHSYEICLYKVYEKRRAIKQQK